MNVLSRQMDRVAVLLSGICLVHCLMLPLALGLFPLLALGFGTDEHFHELMLWAVLPISIAGLGLGYRQHRRLRLVAFGGCAMALLAFASTWGHRNLDAAPEAALMVVGSVALATAHILNLRAVRRCGVPDPARAAGIRAGVPRRK